MTQETAFDLILFAAAFLLLLLILSIALWRKGIILVTSFRQAEEEAAFMASLGATTQGVITPRFELGTGSLVVFVDAGLEVAAVSVVFADVKWEFKTDSLLGMLTM